MKLPVGKVFIGYIYCPVCKEKTRHYDINPDTRFIAKIFCDKCRVMRFYRRKEIEEIKKKLE